MRVVARIACALLLAFSAVGGFHSAAIAAPGAAQLVSWSALCSEVSAGRFVWKAGAPAQCTSLPLRIVSWADFTANVNTSGCGSGNPLPTYQQLINCRTLAGLVSASVSGTANGYQPQTCSGPVSDRSCIPAVAASPLDTSTSSTTTNPNSSSVQISWNVTPSQVSGTCSLSLIYGSTTVSPNVYLSTNVPVSGSYILGAGAGAYTLHIACSTNNSAATVSGTLSWYQ